MILGRIKLKLVEKYQKIQKNFMNLKARIWKFHRLSCLE